MRKSPAVVTRAVNTDTRANHRATSSCVAPGQPDERWRRARTPSAMPCAGRRLQGICPILRARTMHRPRGGPSPSTWPRHRGRSRRENRSLTTTCWAEELAKPADLRSYSAVEVDRCAISTGNAASTYASDQTARALPQRTGERTMNNTGSTEVRGDMRGSMPSAAFMSPPTTNSDGKQARRQQVALEALQS